MGGITGLLTSYGTIIGLGILTLLGLLAALAPIGSAGRRLIALLVLIVGAASIAYGVTTEHRRSVDQTLGDLLREGQAMLDVCLDQTQPIPADWALAWDKRADEALAAVSTALVTRFEGSAGALPDRAAAETNRSGLCDQVRVRTRSLNTIVSEL